MDNQTDSIRRLLEMLDNPEAYSEQEMQDIINCDDSSREAYRQMVLAAQASRMGHALNDADSQTDAAWQRFESRERRQVRGRKDIHTVIYKMVAAFAGVLLVSGIAYAAISMVSGIVGGGVADGAGGHGESVGVVAAGVAASADTLRTDSVAPAPVVYDNVPLERILADVAVWHKAEVLFRSGKARRLRLYFVWYREQPLAKVVDALDHFESVDISLANGKITVK